MRENNWPIELFLRNFFANFILWLARVLFENKDETLEIRKWIPAAPAVENRRFFNGTSPTEIYTLSLPDALPR